MGAIGTTKEGGFVALKPMVERFGVEVTGRCRICGAKGRTEMHHIITASRIAEMDRSELKRLYRGVVTHGRLGTDGMRFDEYYRGDHAGGAVLDAIGEGDRLRRDVLESLPANIIELCIPCLNDTEWVAIATYRRWKKELEAGRDDGD